MSVKVKIKHLKPGTVFNAGPVAVRVLEHFADGKTLVITDECIAYRPFTCQPFKPNLFVESEIEVEVEEDEIDLSPSTLLEGFTTRQLVEELFRRIGTEKENIEDNSEF